MQNGKDPSAWTVEATDEVADCRVFRVVRHRSCKVSDGRKSDWYVIDTRDFVNVVALTPHSELVLVRQFRHGTGTFSWEIPGGMVDEGEDPLRAGVRELREETGFEGTEAGVFAKCDPNPAIMNNRCHYVLVRDAVPVGGLEWDEHEEMEIRLMPMEEVWAAAARGEFTHSLTLAALFRYSLL